MATERIDSIYDLSKIIPEHEKIVEILKQDADAIVKVNNLRLQTKGADLSTYTKSANDLNQAINTSTVASEKLVVSSKEYQKIITETSNKTKEATSNNRDYNKAVMEGKLAKAEYNKELKNEIQLEQAAIGSINQKKVQLAGLQKSYDALSATQRNADDGKKLLASIKSLDKELKILEGETGRFQRNVGNYSGAVGILKKSFEEVAKKIEDMTKAGKTNTDVFAQLDKEYQLLNKLVNSQEAGFANATMEIRANQRALLDLENAGLAGTESFKKLEKETGNLQDQLSDLQAKTKQLGSDTFVFDGLISAAQGLAGAYGAAQGVAALFGEENEDLQKSMVKLQAVMTVLQGLQAVKNALQKQDAAMLLLQDIRTKALSISQGIYTIAVGTSTGAMRAFRIALLATGIGAIIGLLVLAADAMGAFGSSTEDTTEDLQKQAEAIEKNKQALADIAEQAEKNRDRAKGGLNELKRELELATARGDSEKKLQKIKDEIAAKEISNLKVQFYTFENHADKQAEITEEMKDVHNKNQAEQLEIEKKALEDAEKLRKKNAEDEKKRREKALEEAKKFNEDETSASFNIFRDNAEEKARIAENESENEENSLEIRLSALTDYYIVRRGIIEAQQAFDLIGIKKGSQQEKEIVNKSQIELIKLLEENKEKGIKIIENDAENQLAIAKDVTDKKIKLVDEETQAIRDAEAKITNDSIIALNDRFKKGLISKEEYDKERAKLDLAYQIQSLKTEIAYQKKLIAISNLSNEDKAAAIRRLNELERELSQRTTDEFVENESEKREAILETLNAVQKHANEVFSFIGGLLNASTIAQKNALKEQRDEAEKKAALDIESVNASMLGEEKKAAQVIIINARLAAQKDQIAQKEKQAELQKAKFEKATAIFNIILSTAAAVVKALPNIPLSILAGVLGAAQLAVAIATPIPKYKGGRGFGKDELALVHPGEFIHRESGALEPTPAIESLTHLMPRDKVYPSKAAMMKELALSNLPLSDFHVNKQGAITKADMEHMVGRIEDAVGNINIHTHYTTKDGQQMITEKYAKIKNWVDTVIKGK